MAMAAGIVMDFLRFCDDGPWKCYGFVWFCDDGGCTSYGFIGFCNGGCSRFYELTGFCDGERGILVNNWVLRGWVRNPYELM